MNFDYVVTADVTIGAPEQAADDCSKGSYNSDLN